MNAHCRTLLAACSVAAIASTAGLAAQHALATREFFYVDGKYVAAEASYHAAYDHCTSRYLTQAGVPHTFTRLETLGIRGNGHMMMLEKNNQAIAAYLQKWLIGNVR